MADLGRRGAALSIAILLAACNDELIRPFDAECDDAIGWAIEVAGALEVPRPEFDVECETGWGHGVATRAASETVALPHGFEWIAAHPLGGFLLRPYGPTQGWSDRLGFLVAESSLLWVDESLMQVHWRRDDLEYRNPTIITTPAGLELWVIGWDDEDPQSLSRIDASTGELLERISWPDTHGYSWVAAWPSDGGLWYEALLDYGDDWQRKGLYRMASFGEAQLVREREVAVTEGTHLVSGLHPTPGGGALWGYNLEIESVAEDGSLRWTLTEPHCWLAVDDRGGFLLECTSDEDIEDQRAGLGIQRRSQADGSLLWSRVHHRYAFVEPPRSDHRLGSYAFLSRARPGGGYVLTGAHAYPSTSCPGQPLIMAIDEQGEVEWAHRSETCGSMFLIGPPTEHAAFVRGASHTNGDSSNGNIAADWVHRFDL
jgi:hypothetical protein